MTDNTITTSVYSGPSMNPTLKAPDILEIVPYDEGREIRRGDVIVFVSPKDGRNVTHRVISTGLKGVKTRGDNNNKIDPYFLSRDDINGQVVYAQRGTKRRQIYGGTVGLFIGCILRMIHFVNRKISLLLHPVYNRLARSGVFRRLLPSRIRPRLISFKRHYGTEYHLLIGKRVIGKRLPGNGKWRIKRPFKLFVDEASLPPLMNTNIHE